MSCVADAGNSDDPRLLSPVRSRLTELGFDVGESVEDLRHSSRVFLCAAAGESMFEDSCDGGVLPCTVEGVRCNASTPRATCLRASMPCVHALSGGDNALLLTWLRAPNAPRWRALPSTSAVKRVGLEPKRPQPHLQIRAVLAAGCRPRSRPRRWKLSLSRPRLNFHLAVTAECLRIPLCRRACSCAQDPTRSCSARAGS